MAFSFCVFCCFCVHGGRVVRYRTCDREVAGSNPTHGCCVPTPTQRTIPPASVNEYQQKLGSKRAYHALHWPRIRGLAASAGVRLRAKETEISAAPWALRLVKGLYFYWVFGWFFIFQLCAIDYVASPSVLWYCWLGLLTCKNRLPYNLYCVGGDVKHCSLTH